MNKMTTHYVATLGGVMAILMFLQCSEAQTLHVVGDNLGWRVPQDTAAYQTWANNNNFAVGDTLTFNFLTNQHDVVEVPKESYDSCSSDNSIGSIITNGPANITLNKAGEHYYICTFGQHCQNGQKLAINVSGSPSAGAFPPSTATPPDAMNTPPPQSSATPPDCNTTPPPHSSATPPNSMTAPPPQISSAPSAFASVALILSVSVGMAIGI